MSAEHPPIFVNTRVLLHPVTGTQRYLLELMAHLGPRLQPLQPRLLRSGLPGHLWEQTGLPWAARRGLLWSPANTGPVAFRRQVVTVHDVAPLDHPEWFRWRYVSWYRRLLPALLARARRIIVPSTFTRSRILALAGPSVAAQRVHVVPHGIEPRFRPQDETAHRRLRERLGLGRGPYLLSLGSLEPRKNLPALLAAWQRALPCLPAELSLAVAGEVGLRRVFRQAGLPRVPERVRLLGRLPDDVLPALYSGAVAFVFLPHYEGFGMPLLEAMACGTPVLGSRAAALQEVGGNALVSVNPADADEVARALCRIVDQPDLRRGMRERGLRRARAYSWPQAAEETWAILQAAQRGG